MDTEEWTLQASFSLISKKAKSVRFTNSSKTEGSPSPVFPRRVRARLSAVNGQALRKRIGGFRLGTARRSTDLQVQEPRVRSSYRDELSESESIVEGRPFFGKFMHDLDGPTPRTELPRSRLSDVCPAPRHSRRRANSASMSKEFQSKARW